MDSDFKHGRKAYNTGLCRCEVCREESKDYRRQLAEDRKRPAPPRLSCEPLIRALDRAGRLGEVEYSKIHRWRKDGMDLYAADVVAIRLGFHPATIWGADFYAGCFDA